MSCMLCDCCGNLVDTDADPDSLYVPQRACLCHGCRDELDEPSEFEADADADGAGGLFLDELEMAGAGGMK